MSPYAVREILTDDYPELQGYSPLLRRLLIGRGIKDTKSAEAFINPDYVAHSHDPLLFKDMEKAVSRIIKAVNENEKIIIFGDYDADGIPAGVIVHDFFKKIGFNNFENYIPHRNNEGFGLNLEAIESFSKSGVKLIITLDCGIADVGEVARANELGMDVIITDHHLPLNSQSESGKSTEYLPKAFAIVNPKQKNCDYPEKMLCGAGVAFKLIQALIKSLSQLKTTHYKLPTITVGWEKWLLDMVGIATLSDMVPLTGENRVFAHYGLKVLRKSPRVGLMKLLRKLKTNQRYLTEDDIGFTISPRINAASRMGLPKDAFRLFATTDETEADQLSDHLNSINDERKGLVASMVKEVKKIMKERYADIARPVIVIGNPDWKPSLLGLVANSLMEEHIRPVFLWGREGGSKIKGSCRSDGSVDVTVLMEEAKDIFEEYGGHALSGGFSVSAEKIHLLEAGLEKAYEKVRKAHEEKKIWVDEKLSIEDISWDLWEEIDKLSPFGVGNAKPLFLFENISPISIKHFGKQNNHLEIVFKNKKGLRIPAIAFFTITDDFKLPLKVGEPINLVAHLEKSMFRNTPELRLRIIDII